MYTGYFVIKVRDKAGYTIESIPVEYNGNKSREEIEKLAKDYVNDKGFFEYYRFMEENEQEFSEVNYDSDPITVRAEGVDLWVKW
jgi:hypothetical protein